MASVLQKLLVGLCLTSAISKASPSAPATVAQAPSPLSGAVTLSWSAVPGATGYKVKRGASPTAALTLLGTVTTTTFTDTTATPGSFLYYTVTATDATGESPATRGVWAAPGVILDNVAPGGSAPGLTITGNWLTTNITGSHGTNAVYAGGSSSTTPTATYTFTPTLPARGNYDVYLRWSAYPNRATNTPVDVVFPDGQRTFILNQEINGGVWNLLTNVTAEAGTTTRVVIRNNGANENVVADAVQFVPRHAPWAPAAEKPQDYTILPLTDHFDGTAIDSAIWSGFAGRNNYSVSGGRLRTKLSYVGSTPIGSATSADLKNEANWSEGGISSRHNQKFGYHEARLRIPQAPATGVDMAYWHVALDGALRSYEIDAPEFFNSRTDPATNNYGFGVWNHLNGVRTWDYSKKYPTLGDVTQFITIGLEWRTDNSQVVYINGQKVYTAPSSGMNDTESIHGSAIILSTKVLDWLNPNAALDGQEALWDYTSYYQKPGWLGAVDGTWNNAANWGPDGLPGPGFAAVFNVPNAPAAVSLTSDQTLQSLYLDGATLPAHTFSGPGKLILGAGKPGDASVTHGGIGMSTDVTSDQTVNTDIVGLQTLQFVNHSRVTSNALRLNGLISGDGVAPRDIEFTSPIAGDASDGVIILGQPLGPGIRHVHKAGDTSFTLPANSQHSGELRIVRGPVVIPAISSLGTDPASSVVLSPKYLHSDPWRPRLTYTGPAASSAHTIRFDGRFPDGILESNGTGPLSWTGNVIFGNGGSPSVIRSANPRLTLGATTSSGNNVFAGNISDANVVTSITNSDGTTSIAPAKLSLNKTGSGTWILTGTNSLSSTLSVSQGKLVIGSGTSGSLALTAPAGVSTGSGAELIFDRDDATTFSAPISGAGTFRKRGAGVLALSGTHTYSGSTVIEAGTLTGTPTLSSAVNVGSGHLAIPSSGIFRFAGALTFTGSGRIVCDMSSTAGLGQITSGAPLASPGTVNVTLNSPGSTINFTDSFWSTMRIWPLVNAPSRSANFTLGTVTTDAGGRAASAYGTFSIQNNANGISLAWLPTGLTTDDQWRFTWFGTTSNTGNAADSADPDNDGITNAQERALNYDPTVVQPLTFTNTSTAGSLLWSTASNWSPAAAPAGGTAARIGFFTGQSLATGTININVDPVGPIAVNQLNLNGTRNSTSPVVNLTGSAFSLSATGSTQPSISLTGPTSGFTYNVANALTLAATTTIDGPNSGTFRFNGPISGTGGLTRTGGFAIVVLTANNSYEGTTTLSAGSTQVGNGGSTGTLGTGPLVNNASLTFNRSGTYSLPQAISGTGGSSFTGGATYTLAGAHNGSGAISVSSTSTLVVSGGISSASNLTLSNTATLENRGSITLTGNLAAPASTTFRARLGQSGAAPLNVAGTVTLGATLALDIAEYLPQTTVLTLVNKTSAGAISGTFSGRADNTTFTVAGPGGNYTFRIRYIGGDGNDVTLTVESAPPGPPVVTVPDPITVEAAGPAGTVVNFVTSAVSSSGQPLSTTNTPASGSLFPLGVTTVSASATSGNLTSNKTFTVTVVDSTAPIITLPADLTVEATGPSGAVVNFAPTASDAISGAVVPSSSPASGSTFPLGTTAVTVTAADPSGNTATGSFNVTVVDTTGPALTVPASVSLGTADTSAAVTFTTWAVDLVNGAIVPETSPPSGFIFPLGTSTVTASATDAAGNTTTKTFNVTVYDSTGTRQTTPGGTVETPTARDARLAWWREAKFGMFVHWGPTSVYEGAYNGQEVVTYADWMMFGQQIPVADYTSTASTFNPVQFNAEDWVLLAKAAGQKYIVLTAKHHDGHALWPSDASNFDIADVSGFPRNILQELVDACREHGLKVGFYYSHAKDWNNPGGAIGNFSPNNDQPWDPAQAGNMDDYLTDVSVPQVRELLTEFGPIDMLWFDTPANMTDTRAAAFRAALGQQPNLIVNDRLGGVYQGDFDTPEGSIPATAESGGRDFETCMTIGDKWFYNRYDTRPKSYSQLLRNLIDISHKGGNFLLNVGPDSQGRIPGYAADRLQRMGEWLRLNGESIYGTVAGPWTASQIPWGRATRKGNRLYLHVFDWPADGTLEVPLASTVTGARLLASPTTALTTSTANGQLTISLPATAPDPVASVIIVDYSGTLTSGNSAPVVVDGNAVSTAGAAADLSLRTLASDDVTATTSLVFAVSNGIGGTVALQPDGHTARFTPAPGFTGDMSYTFTARDAGNLTSAPATVRISEPVVTRNWTSASTGNWSTAGNWNPATAPASSRGSHLSFFSGLTVPGASRTFTQDIATPLRLNRLSLTGTGASGANLTLDGNGLEFVRNGATLPTIDLTCTGGVATYNVAQPITLGADLTINGPNSATHIFSGVISGPGGITRTGEYASLIFTANSTYTGPTRLLGGSTQIGNGGTTGSLGSGPLTLDGSLSINRSNAFEFSQAISGSGSIVHNGTGTTTLGSSNSYSGTTNIHRGILVVSSLNSHNDGVPPLSASSLGAPLSPFTAIIGLGSSSGSATLRYTGPGETTDRPINLRGTFGATLDHAGSGLLKFTSDFQATGAGSKTLTLTGSGSGEIAGAIVDNSLSNKTSLAKSGSGTWILSGNPTYTGTTTVSAGNLTIAGTLASPAALTVSSGATLSGSGTIASPVTINGTLAPNGMQLSNSLSLASTARLRIEGSANDAASLGGLAGTSISITSGAALDLVFNAPNSSVNFLHAFWRSPRSWPVLAGTSRSGTLALGTVTADASGNPAATYGTFSLEHTSTGVNLLWTPLPGFAVVENPAIELLLPLSNPVTLPDSQSALRLALSLNGGTGTTLAWTKLSGPGTVTFGNATSTDTTASFSADGTYVLRATATNTLGSSSLDLTVRVNPATTLSLRQGQNGYIHTATFIRSDTRTWNSGARDQFIVGRSGGTIFRSLLSFPLGSLPPEAVLQSVSLDLWTSEASSGNVGELQLRHLTGNFNEGSGNGSSSAHGIHSGADWNSRVGGFALDGLWAGGGGLEGSDYEPTTLSTREGFSASVLGLQHTFPTTNEFLDAAATARASGQPLNLLLFSPATEAGTSSAFVRLGSDENGSSSRRPLLTLGFSLPTVPVVNPGSAPAAEVGIDAPLNGSASDAITTQWSHLSGPGSVIFGDPASPVTTVRFSHPGTHLLRLSAANGSGESSRTLSLTVTGVALTALESWRQTHFGTTANTGSAADSADPDFDGLENLLEFAIGTLPNTSNSQPGSLLKNGSTLEFTYPRSHAAVADGVAFAVEWSDTLGNDWTPNLVTHAPLPGTDDGTRQLWKASVPAGTNRRFLHLRITAP